MYLAVQNGHEAVVKLLLDNGAKVNSCNVDRDPLSVALKNDHKKIVELLLSIEGLNVNIGDRIGSTPLHITAITGRKEIAKLLLAKVADANIKNHSRDTPLQIAEIIENSTVFLLEMDTNSVLLVKKGVKKLLSQHVKNSKPTSSVDKIDVSVQQSSKIRQMRKIVCDVAVQLNLLGFHYQALECHYGSCDDKEGGTRKKWVSRTGMTFWELRYKKRNTGLTCI